MGRMDANKNHEMMIRAFASLADKYPEYTLTIYGDGELHSYLEELAGQLGIGDRVFLPGMIQDVAA